MSAICLVPRKAPQRGTPVLWGHVQYHLSDRPERVAIVTAGMAQPESVWVNSYPPSRRSDWGPDLRLTLVALPAPWICGQGTLSKLSSPFQSEGCVKGECQTRKAWSLAVLLAPHPLPWPQPLLLSVGQQLGLSRSVRGALWARGDKEEATSAATLRRGGGLAPRRLVISDEE